MTARLALVERVIETLSGLPVDVAIETADDWLSELSQVELAALLFDWEHAWARAGQLLPAGHWRTCGFLGGRRLGKTRANAEFVVREIMLGRAKRIGFMAQTEDKTFEFMVEGDCGLLACSPPWFAARWHRGRVVWPNGAEAFPFSPEVPGNLRGPGFDLFWASELQSWPANTMQEAWFNAALMTSLGYAKTIWDATPKRRHPLIKMLLARAEAEPERHIVMRGTIWDNRDNLAEGVIEDIAKDLAGTQREREELYGEFLDAADGALWRQEWIEEHRRLAPTKLERRIIALDPGRSEHEGADPTGDVELGLGIDGQVHVLADYTKKRHPSEWVPHVINRYLAGKCDCIIVEEDSGGFFVAETIKVHAMQRGIEVALVKKNATTRHAPGEIYVRSVNTARKSKAERAEPVAAAYERGKVSHTIGADLEELETELTCWEPDRKHKSPNRLDALVHGVRDLLNISDDRTDYRQGFVGLREANQALAKPAAAGGSLASLLVGGGRGSGGTI